jgi:FkbM family methyltransferase
MTQPFLSYAQNFEDVMLWRALKGVDKGFYIDVGAAWPRDHSVTAAFYDRDWRGINIEPNPSFFEMLRADRPRDINLNVLIGENSAEQVDFFVIQGTGLSTTNKSIADGHLEGGFSSQKIEIAQSTLVSVIETHCAGRDIHFLKVDAEGAEAQVLKSNDWDRFRPWICVIEATVPLSEQESYIEWDEYLISKRYIHAYSDGLNRFYVRQESNGLLEHFKFPPNVFDRFQTFEVLSLRRRIEALEQSLASMLPARPIKAKRNSLKRMLSTWWRSK